VTPSRAARCHAGPPHTRMGTVSVFGFDADPPSVELRANGLTSHPPTWTPPPTGAVRGGRRDSGRLAVSMIRGRGPFACAVSGRSQHAALLAHHSPELRQAGNRLREYRVYVSPDRADAFIRSCCCLLVGGTVTRDDAKAPGLRSAAQDTYRRVRIVSTFGNVAVLVTDGHLHTRTGEN